jgi:hypothetical protein
MGDRNVSNKQTSLWIDAFIKVSFGIKLLLMTSERPFVPPKWQHRLFVFVFVFCMDYSGDRASTLTTRIADCQAHRS